MKEYSNKPKPGYAHTPIPAFDEMQELMRQISNELYYASGRNKAAARRGRKKLQELKQKGQECREQLMDIIGRADPKPKPEKPKDQEPDGRHVDVSDD